MPIAVPSSYAQSKDWQKKIDYNPGSYQGRSYTSGFRARTYDAPDRERVAAPRTVSMGGQGTSGLVSSSIMEARRRARLTGRDLSEAEMKGITDPYYEQAANRLTARRGLALAEREQDITQRGQDIQEGLGYAGLTSAERMKGGELDLQAKGLTSAEAMKMRELGSQEKMYGAGLEMESAKLAAQERMAMESEKTARYGVERQEATARHQTKETSGFFGGGGLVGTGFGKSGPIKCMIISACIARVCYETDIAREYRDCVLDDNTLAGYYLLSSILVPFILMFGTLKKLVKRFLVDRFVDQFEWYFGLKEKPELKTSGFVTHKFLGFCKILGRFLNTEAWIAPHRG